MFSVLVKSQMANSLQKLTFVIIISYYRQTGNTNFRLTFNLMIIINQLNYSI